MNDIESILASLAVALVIAGALDIFGHWAATVFWAVAFLLLVWFVYVSYANRDL